LQPDSLIPDPANPQAWNRFSYVGNRPVNFSDPTGHCPEEMAECRKILSDLLPKPSASGGKLLTKDNGHGNQGCAYHQCSDTNLYALGWENFGQASSILTNPNATYGQKFGAGAYMSYWGGAHGMFAVGAIILAWEAIMPGSMACIVSNPDCESIADNAFVKFDPISSDRSIGELGLRTSYGGGRIWVTQYQYIKDISSSQELETILYRQNIWSEMAGKFSDGATLRLVNINNPTPAGVTNIINGIPQWFTTSNVPPDMLEIIKRINP
jgi:hypothetical protein